MVRQHCPECGSEVPVDDVTGVCHVGHRVNSPAAPAGTSSSAFPAADAAPDPDEPAPWVATVDDEEPAEPRRESDPAAPPPPSQALGSATVPPADAPAAASEVQTPDTETPVSGFAATDDGDTALEPEPFSGGGTVEPEPATSGESLEELAAMAATAGTGGDADTSDLSRLSDDLRADLGTSDLDTGEDFDLGALEDAVAELGGSTPAPAPDLTPAAPGPDAAPDPAVAVADVPTMPDGLDDLDDLDGLHDDAPTAASTPDTTTAGAAAEPVSIRPDHDAPAPSDAPAPAASLDPTNFTASGKRVSTPKTSDGDDEGLVGKLKGLFGR